jgi:hypothetical protein
MDERDKAISPLLTALIAVDQYSILLVFRVYSALGIGDTSMQFAKTSETTLREMGICPENFWESVAGEFGPMATYFDLLIERFVEKGLESMSTESFSEFCNLENLIENETLQNKLYDLFNYLRLFKDGGKFSLYKNRQPEWNSPKVLLEKSDVPHSDIDLLRESTPIYRGMSLAEFESNRFGQSWTTNIDIAERFAFQTYIDEAAGIVAVTLLKKSDVIYYSKDNNENEVIVAYGSITSASKTNV